MQKNAKRNMLRLILILVVLLLLSLCKTTSEPEIQAPAYTDKSQVENFKYEDPRSKPMTELFERLYRESASFTGDFNMKILSGEKLKESNSLEGKIFFDKDTGKVKIQLMIPLWGLVVSQIISDSETIKIKTAGQEKIHTQPMGDIFIIDPTTNKKIPIPFPVIYRSIAQNFVSEFKNSNSSLSPKENRVFLKKGTDEFKYIFYENGLASLEFNSTEKKMRAICQVPEDQRKGFHPPSKLVTRVTNLATDSDAGLVDVAIKNVKKSAKIPESTFQF